MEQRTLNIINICKDNTKYAKIEDERFGSLSGVVYYMSDECRCPVEHYDRAIIFDIMFKALQDYIRNCSNPAFLLFELKSLVGYDSYTDRVMITSEKIATLFSLQTVHAYANSDAFVNGFSSNLNKLDYCD